MIRRKIESLIEEYSFLGKAIILTGPRQVGKTTLIKYLQNKTEKSCLFLDCDEPDIREYLTNPTSSDLRNYLGENEIIYIDEAQRVKNIGITLKLMVDNFKEKQFIVTGSSAIDMNSEINEPLTGRTFSFTLLGLSWNEIVDEFGFVEANRQLQDRIIFGMYPEIVTAKNNNKKLLKEITTSYLFKDLFTYKEIRKPELLEKLVKALALQIGSQVSYNELAKVLKIDKDTVNKYVELLEQAHIIFRISPYHNNLRTEITKMQKIYFYDTGVRNVILGDFNLLDLRQDKGALWENFLIAERIKKNIYLDNETKSYFWRTRQQQEVDYIELESDLLSAFEFKWINSGRNKISKTFTENYNAEINFIDKKNFNEFLK